MIACRKTEHENFKPYWNRASLGKDNHSCMGLIDMKADTQKTDSKFENDYVKFSKTTLSVHQPGIEPGSVPWQGTILPLDH